MQVLTRVIGQYPKTNMLLIDLGWTGCSAQGKESGYGILQDHPELCIKTLKQEAGEVESADGSPLDMARYPIGSMLALIPYHSCASTKQHSRVHVVEGDMVVAEWKICSGW